jgi:hypothetical protein
VPVPRSGARLWIAAGALVLRAVFGCPQSAVAATTSYDVTDQAVVQIIGRGAAITIRTWNRHTVQMNWADGDGFTPSRGSVETRPVFLIPTVSVEEHLPEGTIVTTLLPEDFPVPKLAPGSHDVVRIVENLPTVGAPRRSRPQKLRVMIPESTGLVNVRSFKGTVTLANYHGTTIAAVAHGRVVFRGVSGDAFVQPLNGQFYAAESTFDRLRIRSNRADEVFDGCRVRQIEATTLTGNIIFDDGVFDPGLARFESDRGSIALGVSGGAQVGAHTPDGHVLTVLPALPPPPTLVGSDDDSLQIIGGGGPLITLSSNHGNVFLYDGSLADRRPAALSPAWQSMYDLLAANRHIAELKPAAQRPKERAPLKRAPQTWQAQPH